MATENNKNTVIANQTSLREPVARNEANSKQSVIASACCEARSKHNVAISPKETTNLKPKLRFKEFEGEWEEKKLGDISSKVAYGMNSAAIPFDGKHKYLRITDIDEDSREFKGSSLTSPDGLIEDKFKMKLNDIVFARTGASTGKSYLYNPKDGDLYYAGFLIKFNISKANSYFVYSQTFKESYRKWVQVYSMRSGQPGLNAEEYKNLKINLPTLPEQQKIANFLTAVDSKIQQLQRKKELLETYKKGVMQQLFSQQVRFKPGACTERSRSVIASGHCEEERRGKLKQSVSGKLKQSHEKNDEAISSKEAQFPDWEEKKLGEIFKFKQGFQFPVEEQHEEPFENSVYFIRIVNVTSSPNDKRYVIKPDDEHILSENDLFMVRYGDAGKIATGFNGIIANNMFRLLPKIKLNEKWFYYYLGSIYKKIHALAGSSTMPAIKFGTIENLKINTPSLKEQQKIASYLSALDSKIANVQTQIANTQTFKKGLLQQLFV